MNNLHIDRLRGCLSYDPETGIFTRKRFDKRGRTPESRAGSINSDGYLQIMIDRTLYKAHRLAWLYVHGAWPVGHLDHINGDRSDNRISNLRECSNAENCQNRKLRIGGRLTGASYNKAYRYWSASITINGTSHYIGSFDSEEKAHAAYVEEKAKLHPFWAESQLTKNRIA